MTPAKKTTSTTKAAVPAKAAAPAKTAAPAKARARKATPAQWTDQVPGEPHSLATSPDRDTAPLGAHVSVAGGTPQAALRSREIGASAAQIFTKQANRWAERDVDADEAAGFREAFAATAVRWTCAHDSYLINLASPDPALRARSIESFRAELRRCHALGLNALVSHPGNYMDERNAGIARNADAIIEALEAEPGPTRLLMELTAGQGTVLGGTFEEMVSLLERLPTSLRPRVGVCLDTAHIWAAGYDLATDYDGVWARFGDTLGFHELGCLHLNDSKAALGSHLDRHELIGEGTIGAEAFCRIMTDERLAHVPRIIETPKGDLPAATDSTMLSRLRGFALGAVATLALVALSGLATAAAPTFPGVSPRLHAQAPVSAPRTPERHVSVRNPRWAVTVDALAPTTWGDGNGIAPTVSGGLGAAFGLHWRRAVSSAVRLGFTGRVSTAALTLERGAESWSGGRQQQLDLAALMTWSVHRTVALEAALGAAVLGGPDDVVPFADASSLTPMAEVGLIVPLGNQTLARRPLALTARSQWLRVGGRRLDDPIREASFAQRLALGVRVGG